MSGSNLLRVTILLFTIFLLLTITVSGWVLRTVVASRPAPDPALVQQGQMLFDQHCGPCHGPQTSGVAPGLAGLFGRQAGTTGFANSPALSSAGFVWDAERLDAFLDDPRGVIPGNQMVFFGLDNPEARAAIIAYVSALR